MGKVEWTDLPEELVDLIANRSSSNIDHLRIVASKPWRSAVVRKKRFLKRNLRPFHSESIKTEVLPTTFFRVTQPSSSCPNKGWLIKTRQVFESSNVINLLSPLSNELITHYNKTLDLLNLGISEISQSYNVQCLNEENKLSSAYEYSSRVVFVDNHVLLIIKEKKIWCCKSGEESGNKWTRIKNEECGEFMDIILHKGQVYALDLKGPVWWISLSELNISQYGPSTPVEEYYEIDHCKDKRLVEYCGDLCVVHRFYKEVSIRTYRTIDRTFNFKFYKMDKELVKWIEVSSLEDKALIVNEDSCFTVLASDYHGCLKNAIYFFDVKDEGVKVLKLDDRSIINTNNSFSHSCFQMFSSSFLWKY